MLGRMFDVPWYVGLVMLLQATWFIWLPLLAAFGLGYWIASR